MPSLDTLLACTAMRYPCDPCDMRIQHVTLLIQHVLLHDIAYSACDIAYSAYDIAYSACILGIRHVMTAHMLVMGYCNVAKHKWDRRCMWTCGEKRHACSVMHKMLSWLPSGQNLAVACQTYCTGL